MFLPYYDIKDSINGELNHMRDWQHVGLTRILDAELLCNGQKIKIEKYMAMVTINFRRKDKVPKVSPIESTESQPISTTILTSVTK